MAETSIEWCDYTFNAVIGCSRVSPGCAHCYAATLAARFHQGAGLWGKREGDGERLVQTNAYWAKPLAWERKAARLGTRYRVFCSSMADVFEDHPTTASQRDRLWPLIAATPHLDWLLLTKRPQNIVAYAPYGSAWPDNVAVGTSVENQYWANKRIPLLLQAPARWHFLSCEPLLGDLDLNMAAWGYMQRMPPIMVQARMVDLRGNSWDSHFTPLQALDWVIVGAESGPKHRPMQEAWVRHLRDQCQHAGVKFFYKQRLVQNAKGQWVKEGLPLLDGRQWVEMPAWDAPRLTAMPAH